MSIFAAFAFILPLTADDKLPADLQRLVDALDREVARINERFTRDLAALRARYERADNTRVVEQINNLFGTGKLVLEGKWSCTIDGKQGRNPVTFDDEGNATSPTGQRGVVSIRRNKLVIIQWPGKLWHAYVIDSHDPRRMIGVSLDKRFLRSRIPVERIYEAAPPEQVRRRRTPQKSLTDPQRYLSVTAPSLALVVSFAYFASTPRV